MIPHIPDDAPFTTEQRSWLNGFFAGLYSVQDLESSAPPSFGAVPAENISGGAMTATRAAHPITILYGSQTGTSEGLARKAAKRLTESGFMPEVQAMDDAAVEELPNIRRLLVITSTYGDGEMPDNAEIFWEDLSSDDAPSLDSLLFSVLALGDSSYPDFCQAGKEIDARLETLGARRIHQRIDCDVDVDEPFGLWLSGVLGSLTEDVQFARAA